jgi:hypothetical protein
MAAFGTHDSGVSLVSFLSCSLLISYGARMHIYAFDTGKYLFQAEHSPVLGAVRCELKIIGVEYPCMCNGTDKWNVV